MESASLASGRRSYQQRPQKHHHYLNRQLEDEDNIITYATHRYNNNTSAGTIGSSTSNISSTGVAQSQLFPHFPPPPRYPPPSTTTTARKKEKSTTGTMHRYPGNIDSIELCLEPEASLSTMNSNKSDYGGSGSGGCYGSSINHGCDNNDGAGGLWENHSNTDKHYNMSEPQVGRQ